MGRVKSYSPPVGQIDPRLFDLSRESVECRTWRHRWTASRIDRRSRELAAQSGLVQQSAFCDRCGAEKIVRIVWATGEIDSVSMKYPENYLTKPHSGGRISRNEAWLSAYSQF